MTKNRVYPRNPTFEALASRYRRGILHALHTLGSPQTEQRLASYLAATEQRTRSVDPEDTQRMRREFKHVHLPSLEAAGLIVWKREEKTIKTTTHPALDDPRFKALLDMQTEDLDQVFSALSHEYRRLALTVLEDGQSPMSRAELADTIQRHAPRTTDPPGTDGEEITVSLHHVHLPKLDEGDFIEYDPMTGQATYAGHPGLEDVFTLIYGRDEATVDKLGGFLDGLNKSFQQASREASTELDWPHGWRGPHHG